MKKQILSIFLSMSMLPALIIPVRAADALPQKGRTVNGFTVEEVTENDVIKSDLILFKHKKTNAQVLYVANDDTNRTFDISFHTPGSDTGISHVFEHSTLSASEKYPLDIFFALNSRTAATFMNAFTYEAATTYPLSSISDKQLLKLADYYLDAVFHPLIRTEKKYFDTEAWRYEMTSPEDELTLNGTVYSEMRGAYTADARGYVNLTKTLFPGSYKNVESGGDPDIIPSLTYEEVQQYHRDYYIPSNSLTLLYGDVDYEAYLKLLDGYFSEFDGSKADLTDKDYTPIKGHVEKEFKLPGGTAESVYYAIPAQPQNEDDFFGLEVISSLFGIDSSLISQRMRETFPEVNFGVYFESETTEPCMMFEADNLDPADKDLFKKTVDDSIADTVKEGFDADAIDAIAASVERTLLWNGQEPANIGIGCVNGMIPYWEYSDNAFMYFNSLEYSTHIKENSADRAYEKLLEKYISSPEKSVLVVNIPDEQLAAQKEEELKEKLADIKKNLSGEEIDAIVKRTTEEKEVDTELETRLVNGISVSGVDDMKELLDDYKTKEYPYTDETEDNVRYLTASGDIGDIAEGRIYLDISHLSDEELLYLQLISNMFGQLPTKKHSQSDFYTLLGRYILGGYKFLPADDDKIYYTYNFIALNDDVEKTMEIIYELLFEEDFSDTDTISALVTKMLVNAEQNVTNSPHSFIINRELAQGSEKQAVYNYLSGLEFIEFLRELKDKLEENPGEIENKLYAVIEALKNKSGAVSVFAGNDDGISLYNDAAKKFFSDIPYEEKPAAKRNIPVPEGNEGIIIDGEINFNYIGAPLETAGVGRDGEFYVTSNLLYDKLLIPQLRYVKGAYGVSYNTNEYGTYLCSYRDPQLAETFDYYDRLGELVGSMDITQDDLDGYIISEFVNSAKLRGELDDKWHYISTKVYTSEKELYDRLSEMLDTTPEKVKAYSSVYNALSENGVRATIGKESDIINNADLYDKILIPFGTGEIYIYVDGKKIDSDTAPVTVNDRTLVPVRVIAEALGSEVSWNQEKQEVTVKLGGETLTLNIGSDKMNLNGEAVTLDSAPQIINERAMVPLRAVSEAFDKEVNWKEGCVVIK